MFVVLYRFRVDPAQEAVFVEAWIEVTQALRSRGSLGARLHRASDGTFVSYAMWPSEAARDQAFEELPPGRALEVMRAAIVERLPETHLAIVADLIEHGSGRA